MTIPSIAELCRQLSETSRAHYEAMAQDLDHKVGAAVTALRVRAQLQAQKQEPQSNGAGDPNRLPVVSTGPALKEEYVLCADPLPLGRP